MEQSPPVRALEEVDLRDLLQVERVEQDLFRATTIFPEEYDLYGGQVAAQSLLAAGSTVDPDRLPHSLHGYFLRRGDPLRPTVFKVYRDRDGRSFSARRVVAIQNGKVIFNMAASFQVRRESWSSQTDVMPDVPAPDACPAIEAPRLFSLEVRQPPAPYPTAPWPTRFWARASVPLPADPLVHACVLTYLSDIFAGVLPSDDGTEVSGASIDHAVWFHDDADLSRWILSDYHPRTVGRGRGWYTGSLFTEDGRLVASLAQETLFR